MGSHDKREADTRIIRKRNIMKKYVLGFVATAILLLMSINAYAVDIGLGVEEDDGDIEIDLSVDWSKEVGPWQTNIEFDHVIEESDGEQEENLTYA